MRINLTRAILGAAGVLALTAAVAPAALASPAAPAAVQVTHVKAAPQVASDWEDNGDGLFARQTGEWVVGSVATGIGSASNCQTGGWCEHTVPGGCLTVDINNGSPTVSTDPCQSPVVQRQLWFLTHYTYGAGSGDNWQNEYASSYLECQSAMTSEGTSSFMLALCPDGGGGGFGQKQLWN